MPQPNTKIFRTRQKDPQLAAKNYIQNGDKVYAMRGWHTVYTGCIGPAVQILDANGKQKMIVVSNRGSNEFDD